MFVPRILIAAALMATAIVPNLPDRASADNLRNMPIVARPSRPGHFYGNTVRRVHHRRNG